MQLSSWEDSLKNGQSYCLKSFMVREYQSTKYLTMPREGAMVLPIDNIYEQSGDEEDEDVTDSITDARISGVLQLDKCKVCRKYKARVEPLSSPLDR